MECEQSFIDKTPCHETRCYENFRMKKDVFMKFCESLKEVGNLCDGKKVSIEEAVAMFLIRICHNLRHWVVTERFQHSLHTVNKWFWIILKAVCKLGTGIIHQINQTSTHPHIRGNPKYYLYFKDCIGAIDGTHVSSWARASKQTAFHGRKVLVTQNVLTVCDFDMLFTFVYSGWEGTTNDSKVFLDALSPENNFPKPNGEGTNIICAIFVKDVDVHVEKKNYSIKDTLH
ncbi:hypothetical protein D0Y65_030700 [Glycine soja]|uniref:DUF8040 domain-containing protein n=1 Tax=Glycine soja TaxID=3848 RepID=A0A445I4X6_GLYSO|nr:hypothetical protein D0Y65_030700 [Glycine soja]